VALVVCGATEGKSIVDDPAPSADPVPNGCTSPYGPNPTRDCPSPPTCFGTNEDCVSTSFVSACDIHDGCYQTCNSDKYDCDTTFGAGMQAVCNALTGDEDDSCSDDCDYWADTYVAGAYIAGQDYWEAGQVGACACCDCE